MTQAGKRQGVKTWLNSHLPGTLGQISGWSQCFALVKEHERATGVQFDLVAKVRPGTYWFKAVLPWCSFFPSRLVAAKEQSSRAIVRGKQAPENENHPWLTTGYWGDFLNKTGGAGAIIQYPPDQFFMLVRPFSLLACPKRTGFPSVFQWMLVEPSIALTDLAQPQ